MTSALQADIDAAVLSACGLLIALGYHSACVGPLQVTKTDLRAHYGWNLMSVKIKRTNNTVIWG